MPSIPLCPDADVTNLQTVDACACARYDRYGLGLLREITGVVAVELLRKHFVQITEADRREAIRTCRCPSGPIIHQYEFHGCPPLFSVQVTKGLSSRTLHPDRSVGSLCVIRLCERVTELRQFASR